MEVPQRAKWSWIIRRASRMRAAAVDIEDGGFIKRLEEEVGETVSGFPLATNGRGNHTC